MRNNIKPNRKPATKLFELTLPVTYSGKLSNEVTDWLVNTLETGEIFDMVEVNVFGKRNVFTQNKEALGSVIVGSVKESGFKDNILSITILTGERNYEIIKNMKQADAFVFVRPNNKGGYKITKININEIQ